MENHYKVQFGSHYRKSLKRKRLTFKRFTHARIHKVLSEGSNFNFSFLFSFLFFMRVGRIQIPLLAGHQRPARETPFKWRYAGGLMVAQH